jgi:hypothetical protein
MAEKKSFPIELELPSGAKAVINAFKGRDAMNAQKMIGTEATRYIPALISLTTTIDGKAIVVEDMEEMDGRDFMKLFTTFSEAAF